MSPSDQATLPATRRTRKSIGAHTDVRKARDKENATMDLGSSSLAASRKSRSKSLGPGGLDALKQANGNRRASLAAPSKPPRSILKPTVAPLPEIPPLKKKGSQSSDALNNSNNDELSGSKIALRTEEEQQAAAREREERERRDARRKSLANRRVSFAAEATLHTFHEVEYMQDNTASTHASRRQSSSTPNTANDDGDQGFGDGYEDNGNRNSFGANGSHYRNRDDDTVTSTIYSSDSEPADAVEEDEIVEDEDEDSNSDSDDGTMMTMVTEEVTGTSMGSDRTGMYDNEAESSTLDEVLRLAAHRAGTQNLGEDGTEADMEDEEIIPSFGWIKKGKQPEPKQQDITSQTAAFDNPSSPIQDGTEMDMDMDMDMEMTNAVGKILKPNGGPSGNADDLSMDVTRVYGGILGHNTNTQPEPTSPEKEDEPMDEATMEFTTAIGGIRNQRVDDEDSDANEDMSMELTTVMGGLLGKPKRKSLALGGRKSLGQRTDAGDATMDMDMTVGVGRILSGATNNAVNDQEEERDDETMGMDITTAIGGILNKGTESTRDLGRRIMEEEVDQPNSPNQAVLAAVRQQTRSPSKRTSPRKAPAETENDDDTLGLSAFRGKELRRSAGPQRQPSRTPSRTPSPRKSKSRTPSPAKAATPCSASSSPVKMTPVMRRSTRLSSPEKLSTAAPEVNTPSPTKLASRPSSIFGKSTQSESRTPPTVLTPQRKLTGVGADRNGLGSPRVAELFDRRTSIGDAATEFVPSKGRVAFQDPKEIEDEKDDEQQDRMLGRNGTETRTSSSQEDKNATLNLREMIDSLSPKHNPMRGRKSLHVGSARGLLGKRPYELDDEEEAEEQDGVKRLKGHQASPVKNVRLQNPPSKEETAPTLSPTKNRSNRTPQRLTRFRDVDDETTMGHGHTRELVDENFDADVAAASGEPIHLQDFLSMTSIRFMELTTTKRRQTVAPSMMLDGTSADGQDDMSLERCVVTGACTVPMLELYQHSCRELKKYISEGRRIVREIETDTFEENPPLFREYMLATPDVKSLMDNQFKNVKTHARLLSKAMWYEWRMKLQDGLKEGLLRISDGMNDDEELLHKQSDLLESVLPAMVDRYAKLQEQSENLEEVAQELADCDPEELEAARNDLSTLDDDITQKKKRIAELRKQFEESEKDVETLSERKHDCLSSISESEKVREECRGWTSAEVDAIKGRVDALERAHGWTVTGINGTAISMTYKREIELVFDIASFHGQKASQNIDLWYIADSREEDAIPRTAEKEFFVQCIRDHVRSIDPGRSTVNDVLRIVQSGWDKAIKVSSQIKRVNTSFPTTVSKTSDSSMAICSSLLLVPLETRVEIILNLQGRDGTEGVDISISPQARVVYGEHFNVGKIGEFLSTRIGESVSLGQEVWSDVAAELHERLIARGRKA